MKETWIYIAGAAIILYLISSKKKDNVVTTASPQAPAQPTTSTTLPQPPTQSVATSTTTPVVLNRDLHLQLTVMGNEVKELQRLLNVEQTGFFDNNTESTLLAVKGTNSLTLNQFDKYHLPVVGNIVIANKFVQGVRMNNQSEFFWEDSDFSNTSFGALKESFLPNSVIGAVYKVRSTIYGKYIIYKKNGVFYRVAYNATKIKI